MTALLTAIAVLLGLILLAAIGCFAQKAPGRARQTIALPVYRLGMFLDYLNAAFDRRRLRTMEGTCLEQARLCGLPESRSESRAALEEMARNYRTANRVAIDD